MKNIKFFFLIIIMVCNNIAWRSELLMGQTRKPPVIQISTKMKAPAWALKERELIDLNEKIAELFAKAFVLPNGYMDVQYIHGGGVQAPDDLFECIYKFPLLYSLGADDRSWDVWRKVWDGSIKQLTEQGLFVNEFSKYCDWHHNGEHYEGFWLAGLCKPDDPELRRQALKFTGFYDGTNPAVPNYDPDKKIIRSILHGGAGPVLHATVKDWDERVPAPSFWKDWLECGHDGPVNLVVTCFGTNAFMLTGDKSHRKVVLEYIDAWEDRTRKNNGIIPSIVRLDGTVPEEWWGGVLGWNFEFGGLFQVTEGTRASCWNALLMTGKKSYFDQMRILSDTIWNNRKDIVVNGAIQKNCIPRYFGKKTSSQDLSNNQENTGKAGWYGYITKPYDGVYPSMLANLYLATMREDDRDRILDRVQPGILMAGHAEFHEGGYEMEWIKWLTGRNDGWPEHELDRCIRNSKKDIVSLENEIRSGTGKKRPSATQVGWCGPLVNVMTGGIMPLWHGQLLYSRFRYFDPERKRPGIPEDCAAMVDNMTDSTATLILVNLNTEEKRTILIQTGAYAEHKCLSVEKENRTAVPVNGSLFTVELAPGCGQRLIVQMKRFVNEPTLSLPWNKTTKQK